MDELIRAVARALAHNKISLDKIHSIIIANGWPEEDAFFAIKAGQILHASMVKLEEELNNKPPPFGRKP